MLIFLAVIAVATSTSSITRDIIRTYQSILPDGEIGHYEQIINLHDDDAKCSDRCRNYLQQQGLYDVEPSWERLEEFIDSLYGDMISTDPYAPQEIKLALTGVSSEMKVMWLTASPLDNPIVEYKVDDGNHNDKEEDAGSSGDFITITADTYTYTVPENWWPTFHGSIYEANMNNLLPNTRYIYRVGGYDNVNNTMQYSEYYSFHSPLVADDPNQKFSLALLADHGTFMLLGFMVADKLALLQDELNIDVVHVVGDLAYAGLSTNFPLLNFTKEDEFERIWDLYGVQMQRTAATRPFMVTNGNHERFYDWASYKNRFKMPFQESGGSPDGFWYSYDYANIHFVSISSEHSLDADSEQYVWLQNDLKKAQTNRNVVPWIVVGIHKPLYCSDTRTNGGYRELLEPLMIDMDVDVLISGHIHAYERIHPVNNYKVTVYPIKNGNNDNNNTDDVYYSKGFGPVYVTQGNSGAMQFESWDQPQPAWSAYRYANGFVPKNITKSQSQDGEFDVEQGLLSSNYTDTFGFGVITTMNSTHLKYEMIPATGEIGKDVFWIVKDR